MSKSLKIKRISTSKKSKKFKYVTRNNKEIDDRDIIQRINKLRIPPAYKNVLIAKNEDSKLQAVGYDSKGRKQYIYNKEYVEQNSLIKYEKYLILGRHLPKIKRDVTKQLTIMYKKPYSKWEQPYSNFCIVLFLLNNCYFRIGNLKYFRKYKSHGILTLQKHHIRLLDDDKFHISFIGKKSVLNSCVLQNEKIYNILKKLINHSKGEFVLDYGSRNVHITSDSLKLFLEDYDENITPKMFRTWNANCFFVSILKKNIDLLVDIQKMNKILKNSTKKKLFKSVIMNISEKFYNTPNVLKKSYLNSSITQLFFNDSDKLIKLILKNQKLSTEKLLFVIEKNK
jgi:DNA topoisomerase I